MRLSAPCLFALFLAALVAGGSAPHRSGSWFVDCDNRLYCAAAATAAGDTAQIVLRVGRTATGGWQISFLPGSFAFDDGRDFALAVDGGPRISFHPGEDFSAFGRDAPEYYLTDETLAERILRAMESGGRLVMMLAGRDGGSHAFTFSLAGLAAAIAYVEEAQDRKDGDRRAGRPDGLVPHPAMRGATPLADGGEGPRGIPARIHEQHLRQRACEALDGESLGTVDIVSGRLDARSRLYGLPCTRSGERVTYRLYRIETGEIGGVETLYFAAWLDGFGWTGTDLLENVAYDEAEATLTARGGRDAAGTCASRALHLWQGWRFALRDYRIDEACKKGPPESWRVIYTDRSPRQPTGE